MRSVLPSIRALLAGELLSSRNLPQEKVAAILGISQSAVSKYVGGVRGHTLKLDDVEELRSPTEKLTTMLIDGEYETREFLSLVCEMCRIIRQKGLLCRFCERSNPKSKIEECRFCIELQ